MYSFTELLPHVTLDRLIHDQTIVITFDILPSLALNFQKAQLRSKLTLTRSRLISNLNSLNFTQETSLILWLCNIQFPPLIVLTRFSFSLSILSYVKLLYSQSYFRNILFTQLFVHLIKITFRIIVTQSAHSFSHQNSIRLTLSHSSISIPRQQWASTQNGNPQSLRCCFRK